MVEKLKSVLKSPRLRLILKSLIFGGFLAFVEAENFSFLSILIFLAAAAFLYFRTDVHSLKSQNFYSFLILTAISLFAVNVLNQPEFIILAIIFFTVLFYLLLGIKELVFVRRQQYFFIKNILLIYSLFALFLWSDKSTLFTFKFLLVFGAVFLIFREWFFWFEHYYPRRHILASLVLSFIAVQLLWAAAILPIGFLGASSIIFFAVYVLFNLTSHYFHGTLNKNTILKDLIAFVLISVFVLIMSTWKVG